MGEYERPDRRPVGRGLATGVVLAGLAGLALITGTLSLGSPSGAHSIPTGPGGSPVPSGVAVKSASPTVPAPTPAPTLPGLTPIQYVPAPLTGRLVSPEAALRHPIAVMIDDHIGARPQSGFNSAAIVFQAPAEGGIPRYMLVFQDQVPAAVGPIRSARQYYIEWAAQWRAMYTHFGGSPQALDTLRVDGHGQLVWNADGFRWSPQYMQRNPDRRAPHNVYTDGAQLQALAARIGVPQAKIEPAFDFAPDEAPTRPVGNAITVTYPYESITFRYDPNRDAYLRYINGSKRPQVDAADNEVVAPTNVVVLRMHFGPLSPTDTHNRLEAADVGSGDAWISTAGSTIHGRWKKASQTAPILLVDGKGRPVSLQPGQTFVEVIALNYRYRITQGRLVTSPGRELVGRLAPL